MQIVLGCRKDPYQAITLYYVERSVKGTMKYLACNIVLGCRLNKEKWHHAFTIEEKFPDPDQPARPPQCRWRPSQFRLGAGASVRPGGGRPASGSAFFSPHVRYPFIGLNF